MSRAKTKQEVVEEFLNHVKGMVEYWENEKRRPTSKEKLEGLAFSFLVMLDGGNVGMPAFDLVPSPHPSDKEYAQETGEDWYEPVAINDDVQLHELYCHLKEQDPTEKTRMRATNKSIPNRYWGDIWLAVGQVWRNNSEVKVAKNMGVADPERMADMEILDLSHPTRARIMHLSSGRTWRVNYDRIRSPLYTLIKNVD